MTPDEKKEMLKDLFYEIDKYSYENKEGAMVVYCGDLEPILKKYTNKIIKNTKQTNTADVKPIVYGKWIYLYDFDGLEICECDKCGVSQEFDGGIVDVNSRRTNFCPNCGAKMEGSGKE